jgi:hypothetical protein
MKTLFSYIWQISAWYKTLSNPFKMEHTGLLLSRYKTDHWILRHLKLIHILFVCFFPFTSTILVNILSLALQEQFGMLGYFHNSTTEYTKWKGKLRFILIFKLNLAMLHEQQRLCGTELDMRELIFCKITQVLNWSY